MEWYTVNDIERIDSPSLLVYPDRVSANIRTAVGMVDGDLSRLRPHVKTNKSPDATRLMLAAGIQKFKCATIAEAEMLAACGAPDVLLAYQPIGPKLERFIRLAKQYPATRFGCLFDAQDAADAMDRQFTGAGLCMHGYLDLDLGMHRTGIVPGKSATALYRKYSSRTASGLISFGLHAYDGHIRDTDFEQRKKKCDDAFSAVIGFHRELDGQPRIVAGGSPTFSIHCRRQAVECSPGTFIYWDKGYIDQCPEQPFVPAALVITRVVSLPDETRVCLDLGHKSVAAENELARRVSFLNSPTDHTPVGQSEEHLVLDAGARRDLFHTGDILYGLPWHICPTVALYERAYTVSNGVLTGEWKNAARDRRLTY